MPSKKKKYNARFPAGRIKKIMQSDEEVGKVAQAVPVIISRTLELFVESLLKKTLKITYSRNAKTLSPSHMKQCIMSEHRFDFLRELVRSIPDISVAEEAANYNDEDNQSSPEEQYPDSDTPYDLSMPSTSIKSCRSHSLPSNGHNGSSLQTHMNHPDYQKNYLKRSFSLNPTSVIRHTTALSQTNFDGPPVKLPRSESKQVPQQLTQHPRLKHQSYSMPAKIENNNEPNTNTYLKPLHTSSHQTAIPPPIANIDYCSKPVVKIDYSNLALPGVIKANSAVATPLSAPANIASMSNNNSSFNYPAAPVINIDLSNIVASPAVGTTSAEVPTFTVSLQPTSLTSSPIHKTKPLSTKAGGADPQSRNSKASTVEPLNSSSVATKASALAAAVVAATNKTASMLTTKSNSYLEMDEDYDNI